ncbi:hypothetical protein EON64_07350 [archaeon]|nr:MAG: hypothetical protein EON64_07350 [archaeon]
MNLASVGDAAWRVSTPLSDTQEKKAGKVSEATKFAVSAQSIRNSDSMSRMLTAMRGKKGRKFVDDFKLPDDLLRAPKTS